MAVPRAPAASPLAAHTPVAERFSPSTRSVRASGGRASGRAGARSSLSPVAAPRAPAASPLAARTPVAERAAAPVPAAAHAHAGGRAPRAR